MAEIIKTDGTRTATTPANGEYFTLEEMQAAVGGMVEIIELDDKQSMILNEEGKLLDLPQRGGRQHLPPALYHAGLHCGRCTSM